MKKIVVVVNKKWEAAPILGIFRAPYSVSRISAKPVEWSSGEAYPSPQLWPDSTSTYNLEYRYVLNPSSCRIECWCLADFEDISDSGKKSAYIPKIVASGQPDLVIAVGTAASLDQGTQGSVIVGCRAFMHDPKISPPPTQSEWPTAMLDKIMRSSFEGAFSGALTSPRTVWPIEVRKRMLRSSAQPSQQPRLEINAELTSVADVNVGDYTKYKTTDPETVDACKSAEPRVRIGSVDTTLALVRAKTDPAPFLFISGIANELGFMNRDVADIEYSANFVASHNAGIVLAWLLPLLAPL